MNPDELRRDLARSYDRMAAARDSRTVQSWKLEERRIFHSLLRQDGKRSLLEIGAGTGVDAEWFQDQGMDVTCVDLSSEMVRLCRTKDLAAHVMDCADLQFSAGSFDAVYVLNCLLHLPRAETPAALREVNRVLKVRGLFYLGAYGGYESEGVWQADSYRPRRFFSFYSDEGLRRVVEPVFDIVSFKRIETGVANSELHFQSMILRKRRLPCVESEDLPSPQAAGSGCPQRGVRASPP